MLSRLQADYLTWTITSGGFFDGWEPESLILENCWPRNTADLFHV